MRAKRYLSRAFSMVMVLSIALSAVSVVAPASAHAAGSISLKSATWAPTSVDVTFLKPGISTQVGLIVKVNNTVTGSNSVKVRIQATNNAKIYQNIYLYGKNGGTAKFSFKGADGGRTYKVVSVTACKRTKAYKKLSGEWQWVYSYKALKTKKVSGPSIKVTTGVETKLALPNVSVLATGTAATYKATLTTKAGKAVAGETVHFTLQPGTRTARTKAAKTNASGVASVTFTDIPREYYATTDTRLVGFQVEAVYKGKAKKFKPAAAVRCRTEQPRVKTEFLGAPRWDGQTGVNNPLSIKVVTSDGKPVANYPIRWSFSTTSSNTNFDRVQRTNASGVSTVTWSPMWPFDWADTTVTVSGAAAFGELPGYIMPGEKRFVLADDG